MIANFVNKGVNCLNILNNFVLKNAFRNSTEVQMYKFCGRVSFWWDANLQIHVSVSVVSRFNAVRICNQNCEAFHYKISFH